jgi:hypothetical protein
MKIWSTVFLLAEERRYVDVEITSIIDWQHTWIGPHYLVAVMAGVPEFVKCPDYDSDTSTKLPPDFKELDKAQQKLAKAYVELAYRHRSYLMAAEVDFPEQHKILTDGMITAGTHPIIFSSNTWYGNYCRVRFVSPGTRQATYHVGQ